MVVQTRETFFDVLQVYTWVHTVNHRSHSQPDSIEKDTNKRVFAQLLVCMLP